MRTTILCLASYEKGGDFLRECRALGCHTVLVTVDKLRDAHWPRDAVDEFFHMAGFENREHVIDAVSYLARTRRIDAIVPLDEFDLELAAALREHLRTAGLGESAVRFFRDKLAMRRRAAYRNSTPRATMATPKTGSAKHLKDSAPSPSPSSALWRNFPRIRPAKRCAPPSTAASANRLPPCAARVSIVFSSTAPRI